MYRAITTPNEWSRTNTPVSGELSDSEKEYLDFWKPLLEELKTTHRWGSIKTDNKNRYYTAGSGLGHGFGNFKRTMRFAGRDEIRAEFIIWEPSREWNKRVFDMLIESQQEIEQETGPLVWERLDESMISRFASVTKGSRRDPEP